MTSMLSFRRPARGRAVGALAACVPAGLVVLVVLVVLGACSSDEGGTGAPPTSAAADGLIAQVASYDLAVGPAYRVIVGVQSADFRLVVFGTVTFRFSYLGTEDAPEKSPVAGPPVTASYLPIPGSPAQPEGDSTPRLVSGSEARGVYGAPYEFERAGFWQVEVTAAVDGATRTATGAFPVYEHHGVPAPGAPAPRTENLTMDAPADVPRGAIDSRDPIPDPELHRTTVAAALAAGRPVVLVVSTPVYCTSQFCGPVTDMVQELSHVYGDRATFIHIEVFKDFQNKDTNPTADEWAYSEQAGGLNEPWVYVIGADGIITARFDNVATRAELEPILQALPVLAPPG
jgi:hypothetical protein